MRNECKFKPTVSHYLGEDGKQVAGTEAYATKAEYDLAIAQAAAGKSGKWYDGIVEASASVIGNVLKIWQPADQYIVPGNNGGGNNDQRDNTMLYVGIGGVVLVVILFAIIALKKK